MAKPKQSEKPVLIGPSHTARGQKIAGVRVTYDVDGGQSVETRDHPTAMKWEVTKHGQLILRDQSGKQIARYRQFVWRLVLRMEEGGDVDGSL